VDSGGTVGGGEILILYSDVSWHCDALGDEGGPFPRHKWDKPQVLIPLVARIEGTRYVVTPQFPEDLSPFYEAISSPSHEAILPFHEGLGGKVRHQVLQRLWQKRRHYCLCRAEVAGSGKRDTEGHLRGSCERVGLNEPDHDTLGALSRYPQPAKYGECGPFLHLSGEYGPCSIVGRRGGIQSCPRGIVYALGSMGERIRDKLHSSWPLGHPNRCVVIPTAVWLSRAP
jgi:hypothetical protein